MSWLELCRCGRTTWTASYVRDRLDGAAGVPGTRLGQSLGFRFVEEREVVFAGVVLRANHWIIDPGTDLIGSWLMI